MDGMRLQWVGHSACAHSHTHTPCCIPQGVMPLCICRPFNSLRSSCSSCSTDIYLQFVVLAALAFVAVVAVVAVFAVFAVEAVVAVIDC